MGLDAIGIVMAVEDAFGIELPRDRIDVATVGEFSDYISKRVAILPPDEVWKTVQKIVSDELNIPLSEVRPDSRWVEDLLVD